MTNRRRATLIVVCALVLVPGKSLLGQETWWSVTVDSTSLGTVSVGADTRWALAPDWSGGAGVLVRLPVFLVARGGGFDTGALEAGSFVEWGPGWGWFLRGRVGTGMSVQSQVLGTLTSWTGSLTLEPGIRVDGGELWLLLRAEASLITVIHPSAASRATFDDRYEDHPSSGPPSTIALPWAARRMLLGVGGEWAPNPTWGLTLAAGVYPPLGPGIGWMDGFSFGEIPFFLAVGSRLRL